MYKKLADRCSLRDKRAQITIFMIIGLLLLFAFLFVIFLTGKLQQAELQEAKESVLSKTFQKEGLRIFVEDCLKDSLTSGLILVGQQGRLWDDQPGGRKRFEQGVTGIQVRDNTRVFYGITKESYNNHDENFYPCNDGDEEEVCSYEYPNQVGFGTLQWRASTLAGDLERYLVAETLECVTESVQTELSQQIQVETTADIDLDLALLDNSIAVQVYYPLKLLLGSEELFSLAEFDFIYQSKFKQLLDSAVAFSLQQDQQFVDFFFDEPTLLSNEFTYGCSSDESGECTRGTQSQKYQSLSIEMNKEVWEETGDDIFEFTLPENLILEAPGEYTFRIARQNRPPALDYISQCPSDDYDYLVVKSSSELNTIDFEVNAIDPDESINTPSFTIEMDPDSNIDLRESTEIPLRFSADTIDLQERDEPYIVEVIVRDQYGEEDYQEVRISVQDGINPTLEFINLASPGDPLSLEDPICVIIPEDNIPGLNFGVLDTVVESESDCLPLTNFNILTHTNDDFSPGQNEFIVTGQPQGEGECSYDISVTSTVTVTECTPIDNSEYPYPYFDSSDSKLNTLYQFDTNGDQDSSLKDYQATRACCSTAGEISDTETPCQVTEPFGCFTDSSYLERVSGTCNGRGNVCGNAAVEPVTSGINTCGDTTKPYCSGIADDCQNVEAGNFNSAGNWCNGNTGCESVCIQGGDSIVNQFTTETDATTNPNSRQQNPPYIGDNFACGCNADNVGFICDSNYDGVFNGVCFEIDRFLLPNLYECDGDI